MTLPQAWYTIAATGFAVGAASNFYLKKYGWMAVGILGVICDAVLMAVYS
jgi:hypothetical protein